LQNAAAASKVSQRKLVCIQSWQSLYFELAELVLAESMTSGKQQ